MGQSCAASTPAHGPKPHRKVPRRRLPQFENFIELISTDGKSSRQTIKYSVGLYTRWRGQQRLPRGEGLQWSDPDRRPELVDKLRQKIKRLRETREGDHDKYLAKMQALWKHAMEARPTLHRQMLLEAMSSASIHFVVDLPELWSEQFVNDGVQSAKELFHSVYHTDGGVQLDGDAGGSSASLPKFEPKVVLGGLIRNPLRSAPSGHDIDSKPKHEPRGNAGASGGDRTGSEGDCDGRRCSSAVAKARTDLYIFDTGASNHSFNTSMLTGEEKRNIRPLDKSVMVDTCNGPIVIDSYVEL